MKGAGIEALNVIGGNGSQTGSYALSEMGFPVIGVASTIDNDLYGSDITIGVDTALNVAVQAIDNLKVTASSHHLALMIEVMGRKCGYLALMAGIAGGAEAVMLPEVNTAPEQIAQKIQGAYERGKPHAIVVVAEGAEYNAEGLCDYFRRNRMYQSGTVPAWAIMDQQHRSKYFWGVTSPGSVPRSWIESGYAKVADTIEELAAKCGIDPAGLAATVQTFTTGADAGVDTAFGRGSRQYNCYYADPTNRPSPTLGALRKPPFWAVQLVPADVGTAGGILTDGHGQAVRDD
jgi:6-phosphofructokinase